MNDVLRLAWDSSLLLVCGSTLLLGLGCAAVAACRSPVHRQRLAELTVGGFLIWLVLTLVPLPRLASPWFGSRGDVAAEATVPTSPASVGAALPVESQVVPDLLPQVDPFAAIPLPLEPSEFILLDESEGLPILDAAPPPAISPIADDELRWPIQTPAAVTSWASAASLFAIVVGLYLVGAAACVALLLVGHGLLAWIRATGKRPPVWLDTDYQALAGKAHIPTAELLVSQRCSRPISWGLLRPAIVLPDRLCRETNRKLVGAILLHELGHVARRDAWGNLLFCLATPLLYCHPLYWWLRREWNLSAELVADDWAAWQTGKDAYVEELMDLARTSPARGFPFVGATAVFSSPSQFYRRMQMLLTREQPLSTRTSVLWQLTAIVVAMLGIALASSLGGVRPALAQDNPAVPAEAPPAVEAPAFEPLPAVDDLKPAELTKEAGLPPADLKPAEPPRDPFAPQDNEAPTVPAPANPIHRNATATNPEAIIQQLRNERAQLEAKLLALQARLRELAPDTAEEPAAAPPKLPVNAKGLIELMRVEKDGKLWSETWTTDQRGQPAKLVKREAAGSIPVEGATQPTIDGTVLKTVEGKDGSTTVHVFDAATGKLIETRREKRSSKGGKSRNNGLPANPSDGIDFSLPPQPKSSGDSNATPSISIAPPAGPTLLPAVEAVAPPGAVAPTPTTRVPERAAASISRRELDLVSLATSYADAVGNLETAQARLADIESVEAKSSGTIPKQEITSARLAVVAAQRKEQLLQRIAKVALTGVSKELDRATQLHKNGVVPESDLEEAQTRAEILKQILGTQPGSAGNEPARSSSEAGALQKK
jgi:beta-lactamase regulating signal transducer with metallopeptidase domain